MNIIITCDQTDCIFNKNIELNVQQLNAPYCKYWNNPKFTIANLLLGTNICIHPHPAIQKWGIYPDWTHVSCNTKQVESFPQIPPSCATCEEGMDSTICINCCHKQKSK